MHQRTKTEAAWKRSPRNIPPANLLVVFLLVGFYKHMRGQSRKVLLGIRPQSPKTAPGPRLQPGGHDFFWILGPPLAADRGGSPDHGKHAAANLRGVPSPCGESCTGTRQGYLPAVMALPGSAILPLILRTEISLDSPTTFKHLGSLKSHKIRCVLPA
jgi:hypothetical protein